jgi:CrcB protein
MKDFTDSLWVAFGASLGANARYWIGYFCKSNIQEFPWPTLIINVLGSLLLGAFSAAALERGWGWPARLFFAVGVCGGFTTFSTFSFETINLARSSIRVAALYVLLSLVLSIGACFAGVHFGRIAFSAKTSAPY